MTSAPVAQDALRELARAARILAVRSRREASELFAGAYRSAFRGGGIEFEESRPYVPGDDVRSIDWNATARTGEPHVKRFREERDRTVLLLLDTSASMGFGSGARSKAETAAHAAALLAAAAGHVGDRVGLVAFDAAIHGELEPARGPAHTWAVIRAAVRAGARARGGTGAARALERALRLARRRAVLFLLSDFRDDGLFAAGEGAPALAAARRHDLVAIALEDPREAALPAAGGVRVADPERPGRSWLLETGSARVRGRYAAAAAVRRRAVTQRLRRLGADVLWMSTAGDPLRILGRFFEERARGARPCP